MRHSQHHDGVDDQLAWLVRERPDYLLTHPTILDRLLRHSAETGVKPAGLKQVLTLSEILPPGLRDLCHELWGASIRDTYSSREVGYLALQCPEAQHYHLQSETVLVEILDAQGRRCAPGEVGRVVATPLHNVAMPLLRYDLGDYAEVGAEVGAEGGTDAGDACRCGRGLAVVRRILGRRQNMLRLPAAASAGLCCRRTISAGCWRWRRSATISSPDPSRPAGSAPADDAAAR